MKKVYHITSLLRSFDLAQFFISDFEEDWSHILVYSVNDSCFYTIDKKYAVYDRDFVRFDSSGCVTGVTSESYTKSMYKVIDNSENSMIEIGKSR
jgi:hypothetical protein